MTDSSESGDPAIVEVDYGVASVYIQGSPDDSIEDVNEVAESRLRDLEESVAKLKRVDYELGEEFESDSSRGPTGSSFS